MSSNEVNEPLTLSPVWKSYREYLRLRHLGLIVVNYYGVFVVYHLQQEAPTAVAILCSLDHDETNKPPYFKNEYHGSISNQEAKSLLQLDGQFLVRESGKSREHHTLSLKFNNELKHYR